MTRENPPMPVRSLNREGPVTPPGFYSSPQMDKIWGQPPAPVQPPPATIQPPPGFSGNNFQIKT